MNATTDIRVSEGDERALLGSCLADPAQITANPIEPEAFHDLRNRQVYEALVKLSRAGVVPDATAVRQAIGPDSAELLMALTENTPSGVNAPYYVERVRKSWHSRLVSQTISEAYEAIKAQPDMAGAVAANTVRALTSIADVDARLEARPLSEFETHNDSDGQELIKNRFLCRGGTLLFPARTGIGKSSAVMQMAVCWSLGRACFGLVPAAQLRSLIIQAENDAGDIAEMRDGIVAGLGLGADDRGMALKSVVVATADDCIGIDFVARVLAPLIGRHRPDLVWLDPLLAYLGGDVNEQKTVSAFLRTGLLPVIHRANAGLIVVHHTTKPPKGEDKGRVITDLAYAGAGSAELANFSRAVMTLEPTLKPGVFRFTLGKRGRRAGWVEADGTTPAYSRMVAHGDGGRIYWKELAEQEAEPQPVGKTKEDLLALVSHNPVTKDAILSKAQTAGIGLNRARGFIAELTEEGRLFEVREARPGVRPIIKISRYTT